MLFRLTRNTCWYRQNLLANTRFHFGFRKNGENDETQSVSKNHPIIKEDGKNQSGNVESHKGNNLNKTNQVRQHPNGTESNMIPISVMVQILKDQKELSEKQLQEQIQARKLQEKLSEKQLQEQIQARKLQEKLSQQKMKIYEQNMKKQGKKSNWKLFFSFAAAISGVFGVICIWPGNPLHQFLHFRRQNKKYGIDNPEQTSMDQWLTQNKKFADNETRKVFKELIYSDMDVNTPLKIVTGNYLYYLGIPGNGKTTEMKQLVKQLRQQGHTVYYHSLRGKGESKEIQSQQQKKKQISELFGLLSLFDSSSPNQGKLIYLVIDDINMLESIQNTQKFAQQVKTFWIKLAAVSQQKTRRSIVVSSSSSYIRALKQKSYVQKESRFIHLEMKTYQEMKQGIKNILDFHFREKNTDSNQYGKTVQYLLKQRYTLRQVMQDVQFVLGLFKGAVPNDQSFLQKFKTQQEQSIRQESIQKRDTVLKMYGELGNQQQKQYQKKRLQKILQLQQCHKGNWLKIQNEVQSIKPTNAFFSGKQTLDDILEKENLLFYCCPRTEKSKKILQFILAAMKNNQKDMKNMKDMK